MASVSAAMFFQQVCRAWNKKDGTALAKYFSLRDIHFQNTKLRECTERLIEKHCGDSQIFQGICHHIKCLQALAVSNNVEMAYQSQMSLVQMFVKIFQNQKNENWFIPVIETICLDLRILTNKLQEGTNTVGLSPREALENTAEAIMAAFRICAADSRSNVQETKRWGMMSIVNQLFKVYFKMDHLHLMKPLIRAIDSSNLKDKFSLAQQVTYKYYTGLKAVTVDGDYKIANQNLTYAFETCHISSVKNKQRILVYLVPVRMSLGYMPMKEVLEKYDLLLLWDIAQAVRMGNIKKLSDSISENIALLGKLRIFTIVEKLRMIAYRNLFKKVYLLHKNHLIDMNVFMVSLQMMESPDVDLDETHCIMANLINEGKIKGYISLPHEKVVLSKLDPFPKLTSLP